MTPSERKRVENALVGRTIVRVVWNAFNSGNAGVSPNAQDTQDPVVILNDGTILGFSVEETEVGEYGIQLKAARIATQVQGR